jgi:hypothetical protein
LTLTHFDSVSKAWEGLCQDPLPPTREGGEHAGPVNLRRGTKLVLAAAAL